MDGRPNCRNKAVFRDGLVGTVGLTEEIKLWPNRRNKAVFS